MIFKSDFLPDSHSSYPVVTLNVFPGESNECGASQNPIKSFPDQIKIRFLPKHTHAEPHAFRGGIRTARSDSACVCVFCGSGAQIATCEGSGREAGAPSHVWGAQKVKLCGGDGRGGVG